MESIGFKEWSVVCDALGRGEQSIILRKGGIAGGRGGFSFRHREFFLFPTFFHEQIGKVTARGDARPPDDVRQGEIALSFYSKVERTLRIASLEMAEALAPLHILRPEVVRERFGYKGEGLKVAFLRVFRLERPWTLANEPRYGGCRSWVQLPEAPDLGTHPVLDDTTHAEQGAEFDLIRPRQTPFTTTGNRG
jgi:hypothetical protein